MTDPMELGKACVQTWGGIPMLQRLTLRVASIEEGEEEHKEPN